MTHARLLAFLLSSALLTAGAARADPDAPPDGQQTYERTCSHCHNPGPAAFFSGAPQLGSAAWKSRLQQAGSIDALAATASKGKGYMPPQGGTRGLSDAELKAAVTYILGKSGL